MRENVTVKANVFKGINELAMKGEIVVFGSTYMANFPFYELINKSKLENAVYNRSIDGLTLDEALEILPDCVFEIAPKKVFLALGEEDYERPDSILKYKTIVKKIRRELPDSSVYLISLPISGGKAEKFNKAIESLCDGKKIVYIEFSHMPLEKTAKYKSQFRELSCFFRNKPLTLGDAFSMANL